MDTLSSNQFVSLNDPEFYLAREQQARALAAKAKEASIRAIHLKMAEEYAAKINRKTGERPTLSFVQG